MQSANPACHGQPIGGEAGIVANIQNNTSSTLTYVQGSLYLPADVTVQQQPPASIAPGQTNCMSIQTDFAVNCMFSLMYAAPNNGKIVLVAAVPLAIFGNSAGTNIVSGPYCASGSIQHGWHPIATFTVSNAKTLDPSQAVNIEIENRTGSALTHGKGWLGHSSNAVDAVPTIEDEPTNLTLKTVPGVPVRGVLVYRLGGARVRLSFDFSGKTPRIEGVVGSASDQPGEQYVVHATLGPGGAGHAYFLIERH